MTRKSVNQQQNVTQIVKVVLGDLKKPRKKKKKKSPSKPKMRSALDVARNPQPYQIPLYYPPFPSVINHQPKQSGVQKAVTSALRNYQSVNAAELKRLRGDLTAYRQEQQTAFKTKVAYPRAKVDLGAFDGASIDDTPSVSSATTAAEPDSDYTPSASSASSNITFGRAEGLVADIGKMVGELNIGSDTQYSPTDVSDFEGLTSGTSVGRGAGGGFKKVSFGEPMDLTSGGESDFAPRASKQQRASRRSRVYVDNPSNRRLGRVGKSY